ncbi:MAG TPA: VOC family protein [Acidobacteriota bacterium]|nr:VOC family protein [Acidobacteriota bacterium]
MRVNYAIVFVSEMDKSVAFYRDLLGLPLRFQSSHWTEFATEGATLALHLGRKPDGLHGIAQDKAPGTCRPGLGVPDLDSFHKRMVTQGVVCLEEPKVVSGSRIAQYADPDGLAISVSEHTSGG